MTSNQNELSFEELLQLFDEAVASLESDGLSLDDAIARYESAVELAQQCTAILQNAELKVSEIERKIEALESDAE